MKQTNHATRRLSYTFMTLVFFVTNLNLVTSQTIHVLNGTSGEFSSPTYPQRYGKNENIYYRILGQPGTIAKLSWKVFEIIDYAPECSDAYMKVILG